MKLSIAFLILSVFATETSKANAQEGKCIKLSDIAFPASCDDFRTIRKRIKSKMTEKGCSHKVAEEIRSHGGKAAVLAECILRNVEEADEEDVDEADEEEDEGDAPAQTSGPTTAATTASPTSPTSQLCRPTSYWANGFSTNGCTVKSLVDAVDSRLPRNCNHDGVKELAVLLNVDSIEEVNESIQTMCEKSWGEVETTEFSNIDPRFTSDFMKEYVQGETFLNLETGTFQNTEEGNNIDNFHDNEAKTTRLEGVEGLKQCKQNSIMCCFGRDRQPNDNNGNCAEPLDENCDDADPADNSNLCYAEYDNSIYPGESEGDIHCHGLAWADDRGDFTYQLQHNNMFYVSLYDHMYQRGYAENIIESNEVPMCACLEDMNIKVSRSDCTQIDATMTFTFKYEDGALTATPRNNLNVQFNACQGTNPSNGNNQNNDLASYMFRLHEEKRISKETLDAAFETLVGYNEPGNNANEAACSQAYEDATGNKYYTAVSDDWIQVYGKGSLADPKNTYMELLGDDSPYLPRSGKFYVRRLCLDCRDTHNDIIYERLTPLPDGFSIGDRFLKQFRTGTYKANDDNNELGVDFELYPNILDAKAGRNKWHFCNNSTFAQGFAESCGPERYGIRQWNLAFPSIHGGGVKNYAIYVYRGNVNPEPPLPEHQDEETLDRWTQVYGAGSLENKDADGTLWEVGSEYVPASGNFYIRRICPGCDESHKDIIYKRLTPLPDDFDLPALFVDQWKSKFGDWRSGYKSLNVLNEDFELYSSMSLALAGIVKWDKCWYADYSFQAGRGFPYYCGITHYKFRPYQWNSKTSRGAKTDYAFYVWNGNRE